MLRLIEGGPAPSMPVRTFEEVERMAVPFDPVYGVDPRELEYSEWDNEIVGSKPFLGADPTTPWYKDPKKLAMIAVAIGLGYLLFKKLKK